MRRLLIGIWQLIDANILITTTLPTIVGAAFAYNYQRTVSLKWLILSLFSIWFLEIAANSFNELIDYLSGADRFVSPRNRNSFSGGKKVIVDGKLNAIEVLLCALVTLIIGCSIGMYIVLRREFLVLYVGLVGVLAGIFYTLPPFKFSYRGLGEVILGLTLGPLIVTGSILVQAHTITIDSIIGSFIIGFLVTNILWINQFPDYDSDKMANKKNLLVRFGKSNGIEVYKVNFIASYLLFLLIVVLTHQCIWIIGLITIPIAIQAVKNARINIENTYSLIRSNQNTILIYKTSGLILVFCATFSK